MIKEAIKRIAYGTGDIHRIRVKNGYSIDKTQATKQLSQYDNDARIQAMASKVPIKKIMLIYNGWELVHQDEVIVKINV